MRIWPAIVTVGLLAATMSPVLRAPSDDGYPLSTYPMFAVPRPTKLTMDYAFGVAADGTRRAIRPTHVGSGEVLQARAILERGVHGGTKALLALCADIARRVGDDPDEADVVEIKVVTGTHDAVEYLVRHQVGIELPRTSCRVPR